MFKHFDSLAVTHGVLCQTIIDFFDRLKCVDSCLWALLSDKNREQTDVDSHIKHTAIFPYFDPMLQITLSLENLTEEKIGLIFILVNHIQSVRKSIGSRRRF